jgi:hypothetical protein
MNDYFDLFHVVFGCSMLTELRAQYLYSCPRVAVDALYTLFGDIPEDELQCVFMFMSRVVTFLQENS